MKRIIVNLSDDVGKKFVAKADADRRSASAYAGLLIEEDLRNAGLLPDAGKGHAELFAKLNVALRERPELAEDVQQLVRKSTRRTRRTLKLTSA